MSELDDRYADSVRVTAYLHKLQQTPPVTPPVEPPIEPPVVPPSTGDTLNYAVLWEYTTNYLRTNGFGANTTLVVAFMVPVSALAGETARVSASEFGGGPVQRDACISTVAGSFSNPILSTTTNPSPLFWLHVGQQVRSGVTYYFNCRQSSPSSVQGNAEVSFQLTRTS